MFVEMKPGAKKPGKKKPRPKTLDKNTGKKRTDKKVPDKKAERKALTGSGDKREGAKRKPAPPDPPKSASKKAPSLQENRGEPDLRRTGKAEERRGKDVPERKSEEPRSGGAVALPNKALPNKALPNKALAEKPEVPKKDSPGFVPCVDNHLVLMAIDPYWAWAYWDAHPRAIEQAKERSGDPSAALVLRFYELTLVEFDGKNANETFDAPVDGLRGNYYINLWSPKKTLIAELGMKSGDGSFCPVARSNPIDLPRDAESAQYAEKFSTVLPSTDSLWKPRAPPLEALIPGPEPGDPYSGPAGRVAEAALASSSSDDEAPGQEFNHATEWASSLDAAAMEARGEAESLDEPEPADRPQPWETLSSPERELFSPAWRESIGLSSAGLPSMGGVSSLEQPVRDERPHLEVKADIVIYGRTHPGTDVVIDGIQVPVRGDGTFDLRFALPPAGKTAERAVGSLKPGSPKPGSLKSQHPQRAAPAPSLNGPNKKES